MKKTGIYFLCIFMLVASLTGCSSSKPKDEVTTDSGQKESVMIFDESKTYENEKYDSGKITGQNVTIKNMTFEQDLIIDKEVGDGNVYLDGVNIKGKLIINGGGKNSIHVDNCSLNVVESDRKEGAVHIVISENSSVDNFSIASETILDISGAVKTLNVSQSATGSTVDVKENAKVTGIVVNAAIDMSVKSPISQLDVNAGSNIAVESTITNLNITNGAQNTSLTLGKEAVVSSLATEATVDISGQGKLEQVFTNNKDNITGTVKAESTTVSDNPISNAATQPSPSPTVEVKPTPQPTASPKPTVAPTQTPEPTPIPTAESTPLPKVEVSSVSISGTPQIGSTLNAVTNDGVTVTKNYSWYVDNQLKSTSANYVIEMEDLDKNIKVSVNNVESSSLKVTAPSNGVIIRDSADLINKINNQTPNETWYILSGTYNLTRGVNVIQNQSGWYFPLTENGIKIMGVNNPIITTTVDVDNEEWSSQNFITVFSDDITIDGVTIISQRDTIDKVATNKAIEVIGNNFELKNSVLKPHDSTSTFAGSIYLAGKGISAKIENVLLEYGRISVNSDATSTLSIKDTTIDFAGSVYEESLWGYYNPYNAVVNAENTKLTYSNLCENDLNDQNSMLSGTGITSNYIERKRLVENSDQLKDALKLKSKNIEIKGTLGSKQDYTIYEINYDAKITGVVGNKVYGSFVVDADNVSIEGLEIENQGWTKNDPTDARRNAITVVSNKVTIKNNNIKAPDVNNRTDIIANGIVVLPNSETDTNIKIEGNTITAYGYDNPDWSSTGIMFTAGQSFPYGTTNKNGNTVSVHLDLDYQSIAKQNTYNNCYNAFIDADYSNNVGNNAYKYTYVTNTGGLIVGLYYAHESSSVIEMAAGTYQVTKLITHEGKNVNYFAIKANSKLIVPNDATVNIDSDTELYINEKGTLAGTVVGTINDQNIINITDLSVEFQQASAVQNIIVKFKLDKGLQFDNFNPIATVETLNNAYDKIVTGSPEEIEAASDLIGNDVILAFYEVVDGKKISLKTSNGNPITKSKAWGGYLNYYEKDTDAYPKNLAANSAGNYIGVTLEGNKMWETSTNSSTVAPSNWMDNIEDLYVDIIVIKNGKIYRQTVIKHINTKPSTFNEDFESFDQVEENKDLIIDQEVTDDSIQDIPLTEEPALQPEEETDTTTDGDQEVVIDETENQLIEENIE
ncbi:MAG: hypothetical protein RR658_06665 [Anaerorhabdus sp.]|uniref:hypothetical protein n=1 Tax=Anaerorhabdus sp. TaxID=1872524 RepID=UPI002FCA50CC